MKYKDILFNWVVDLEEKSQVEEVNSSIHVKSSVVNLPKLEVPHFYGNCENWISFKELFKSSILDNKSISDLEKLQNLQRGCSQINSGFCKNYSERHHTLLHIYSVSPSADTQANSVVTVSNNCRQSAEGHVLLSTTLINAKSKHGEQITCRALIDNASQNSLISKQCADRLKLPLKHTNHKLVGANETFAETSLYSTNFELSSCVYSDKFQDIPSKDEDELCESIFRDDSSIGDSKEGALKRFYSLERKLHSNNQLKEEYTEFMEEYQNLGHMTPLASDVKSPHYFLPHHGVINDNSSTTKLRVVFDGSFKSTNGNSLNDILLTAGADSLDSARKIVHELQNLMSAGGFELRKWSCTHPEVLSDLPNTLKTNISSHSFDDESTQKILGLFWDLYEDSFKVRAVLSDQVSTKRQMLSIIARIFDPLGFVSPSTIILKIILQDLWKAGLDWDDEISDILNRWNRFQAEISCLKQIKVPRVGKIHSLTSKESWHHIPGKLNPADWATRGLYPKQLLENSEWVPGPKWLHDFHPSSNSFIPFSEQPVSLVPIDLSESLSDSVFLSTGVDYSLSFLDKFSSYMKVVRTVA
ncbi:integrase catalytic domain-containing protein [Trichonephila clavipes]|uniref:Integrase catalytic domain-containing protein n=1 Tax=Trichonephila clavipes TaxID=2585209 RepID=A0A8X6SD45_TRICX|nr:integrase catalytic domain-containing protein [Trichonephila clavipes]